MLVTDLDYLQPVNRTGCIKGGASTYAEANAYASRDVVAANSLAVAVGDYASVRTRTSVSVSSGKYVNYSLAYASAFAVAQTGYKYSVDVDYAVDADVSRNY